MNTAFKIVLVINFFFFAVTVDAQKKIENLDKFDQKWYHFGFSLGYNTADFSIKQDNTLSSDTLLVLEVEKQGGFNLNIVSALHFAPLWSLRFTPGLAFAQRNLEYRFQRDGELKRTQKQIESTYIDIPLTVKFRSQRNNNMAAFLLAGGKYSLDLASQHDVDNAFTSPADAVVKIKRHNYAAEVGVGMDFFLPYFKFATQLKYSVGLNDVGIDDGTKFSRPIRQLRPKMIILALTFEG